MLPRTAALFLASLTLLAAPALATNWPAWRGPDGTGISSETDLPLTWSATENVKWKVALPERGNSTPIVWGDRIFLAQPVGERRTITCFDRRDGRQLWQEGPTVTGAEPSHETNAYCSSSPVTDGERVVAWFGSAGLWCWDIAGKEQWHIDLGKQDHHWGYGGSPLIHGDLCFLNFGPGERTFLIAVEKRTGKKVWQVDHPPTHPEQRTDGFAGKQGEIGSWSTPLLIKAGEREELIMTWPGKIVAYEPQTGRELWSCGGLNPLIYSSPVAGGGVVIGAGGFGGSTVAVQAGGSGDVTSNRLWHNIRDKQRIGTGVIAGDYFYAINTPGTAQCIELKTGKPVWEERLQGSRGGSETWSSMVLSGDRIYVLNQRTDTVVIKASPTFEKLAVNALDDGMTNASHAVSNGQFIIRTHQHLWCIGR